MASIQPRTRTSLSKFAKTIVRIKVRKNRARDAAPLAHPGRLEPVAGEVLEVARDDGRRLQGALPVELLVRVEARPRLGQARVDVLR